MNIDQIIKTFERYGDVKQLKPDKWQAHCPAHEDKKASLSIGIRDDGKGVTLHCHANCEWEDVLKAAGLKTSDIFFDDHYNPGSYHYKNGSAKSYNKKPVALLEARKPEITKKEKVVSYIYKDGDGKPVHLVERWHSYDKEGNRISKDFYQKQFINYQWINGIDQIETVPYHLPDILKALTFNIPIWIVEGEKDVENMYRHGYVATCFCSGHNWQDHYKQYFENANVYIIPDNDDAGRKKAQAIADGLYGTASIIRIGELNNVEEKGDVSDWFEEMGHEKELHKSIAISDNYMPPKQEIDIYEVRYYVYKAIINNNKTSYKLIDRRVCEMLWQHYRLVATKIKGKYVFFMYSDGYFQKVDHAEVAKLFDDWLREEDADNYRIDKILKAYPKYRLGGNFVPFEKFNANPHLVNLKNCAYDLKNHKVLPHKQEYYSTYKTEYDYDYYAKCPEFDKALKKYAMSSESWINTFLEICGYIQVGTYEHQKLFWFLGQSGGNGKGTLLRVMHNLVGDHFTFTVPITASMSDTFFRVNLKGKRFAYIPDLEKRFSNLGLIKQMTGGDKQMSDVKYEDAVSFDSTSKIVMAMNDLPDFGDGKNLSPLARRLIILNFKCTIRKEEMNPDIDKTLKSELAGIFLKSMEGLKRLQKNGHFTDTKQGLKKVDELINKTKIVDNWINDNLIFDINEINNPQKSTQQYLLWDHYYNYLQSNHPTWKYDKFLEIKSKSALIKYLQREKFPQSRSISKQTYEPNYSNPVTGNPETKRGSYQALGGLRIMTDTEREAMYLSQAEEETG